MQVDSFNIEIIDTWENNRPLLQEVTEKAAPKLIYNGTDHKYQALMPSELHFSILLNNQADGALLHLYTGSETRYKVLLNDTTDDQDIKPIWEGFLLPEQYSEPYSNGSIFVSLVATDGIGRVKKKYLPEAYYRDQKPVLDIVAQCLATTGLSLPLEAAPAIFNADQAVGFDQIEVDTASYITEKGKKKGVYEILEALVTSLGCKLFQFNSTWYLVGINRMHQQQLLTWDGKVIDRDLIKPSYLGGPLVTMIPQLQRVAVSFDPDYNDNVLPTDLVYQRPEEETVNLNDIPVKHWERVGIAETDLILTTKEAPGSYLFCQLCYGYNPKLDPSPSSDPFYLTLRGYATDVDSQYIQLEKPVYLEKGGQVGFDNLSLEIELLLYAKFYDLGSQVKTTTLKDKFKYEILLDHEVILSNKPIPYTGNFDFILRADEDNAIATLKIDKLPINRSGYLQIRISPPLAFDTSPEMYTLISKLEVGHDYQEVKEVVKERLIDFTTEEEVEIFHGDDLKDLTNRAWLLNDGYSLNDNVQEEDVDVVLNTGNLQHGQEALDQGTPPTMIPKKIFPLDYGSYALVLNNPNDVFILRAGQEIPLPYSDYVLVGTSAYWSISTIDTGSNSELFQDNDTLFVRTDNPNQNITDTRLLRNQWRRAGNEENIGYLEALATIYHAALAQNRFRVDTTALQLVSPLDMLIFSFIEDKPYIPVKLDLSLFEGETRVTLVEAAYNENIEDYGD